MECNLIRLQLFATQKMIGDDESFVLKWMSNEVQLLSCSDSIRVLITDLGFDKEFRTFCGTTLYSVRLNYLENFENNMNVLNW